MPLSKYFLFSSCLFLSLPALAADSLDCRLERNGKSFLIQSPVVDGYAETQNREANELRLWMDATLDPRSFFLVLQDDVLQQRLAFTGSPEGATPEGTSLELSDSQLSCLRTFDDHSPPLAPAVPRPEFLACVLDEVHFVNGSVADTQRKLVSVSATPHDGAPHIVRSEDYSVQFEVKYAAIDFLHGLEVRITDVFTGQSARFSGPAKSMSSSFMFGFSQGNRAIEAKLFRLGCLYTDDPKPFGDQ